MGAPSLRVSVVITAYNRENVISEAIDSCLRQTYPLHEIIVVDDASVDGTASIVQSYDAGKVQLLRLANNSGQCVACNVGIDAASGDVIGFLDSDDLWMFDKIEKQVARLAGLAEGLREKIVVYSQLKFVTSDLQEGRPQPRREIEQDEAVGDYLLLNDGLMQTSTLLVSRSFASAVRFDEQVRRHTDYSLLLRLEAAGASFHMIHEPLVQWRNLVSVSRVSKKFNPDLSQHWLDIHRRYLSPKAQANFQLMVVGRGLFRKEPFKVAGYAIKALVLGALPFRRILRKLRLNLLQQ